LERKYGLPPGRETDGVKERLEHGYGQIAGSCERSKKIMEKEAANHI
jgi:hypothetical protein